MKSNQNIKEYYFANAATWTKYRMRRSYYWNSIANYINHFISPDSSILEVGCGSGQMIASISGTRRVGIDFCEPLINEAKAQFRGIEFVCMDAENIVLNETFDVIILSNLIGVIDDLLWVFHQLHKVSHARTKIIITYYNPIWKPLVTLAEWTGSKRNMPQENWLSSLDLTNLLYLSGFETYKSSQSMLIPYKIPFISNFVNRFLSKLPLFNFFALNKFVFARPMPSLETVQFSEANYSTTVVIPACNRAFNIEQAILRMPNFGSGLEIVFVEYHSTDATWATIQSMQEKYRDTHSIKVIQHNGEAKRDAIRKGLESATGDILLILDADLTVSPEDLPKFYNAISTGKGEFINGVRLVYPRDKKAMRSLNVRGNRLLSKIFSWILEIPLNDTLCSTKGMFRTDYIRLTKNRTNLDEFADFGDYDLLLGAFNLNLKIIDLPIRYKYCLHNISFASRLRRGITLFKLSIFAALKFKFI